MGDCSHPSIEDLGIVFEIEEVGNFSWNIVRYWLWHCSLYQDLATRCESVSHPKMPFTDVDLEDCASASVSTPWVLVFISFRYNGTNPFPS